MQTSDTSDLQQCFTDCGLSTIRGIKLSVPDLFLRPDFISWLNSSNAMTWHNRSEPYTPDCISDVVVFVDPSLSGEGTDDDMPGWEVVVDLLKSKIGQGPFGGNHFVVVLSNV